MCIRNNRTRPKGERLPCKLKGTDPAFAALRHFGGTAARYISKTVNFLSPSLPPLDSCTVCPPTRQALVCSWSTGTEAALQIQTMASPSEGDCAWHAACARGEQVAESGGRNKQKAIALAATVMEER
jgi:hypothetical protein